MTIQPTSGEHQGPALVNPRGRCKAARVGTTASPDWDRNSRQVKELQVNKKHYKAGDEVVLVRPDSSDRAEGLGENVVGTVLETKAHILKVNWGMNGGKVWHVIDTQVKPFRPSAAWKYRRANKAMADYLTAQADNKGVFVQGPHGESVYVHFSGGDIALTVWGRSGRKVNVSTADNMHATTEQF